VFKLAAMVHSRSHEHIEEMCLRCDGLDHGRFGSACKTESECEALSETWCLSVLEIGRETNASYPVRGRRGVGANGGGLAAGRKLQLH
jgi:hypothetical protein